MSARATPSPVARSAAAALDGLVRARVGTHAVGDAFFDRDWTPLWTDLADGGWTRVGDASLSGGGDDLDLLDLTLIAETWGAHLVPLPLLETIGVRALGTDAFLSDQRLTYSLRADGVWLIPFGELSDVMPSSAADPRPGPAHAVVGVDRFARSLPTTISTGQYAELPVEARNRIAVLTGAGAVGAAAAALRTSIAYAQVREQFERPIGSFQAVKHRLADMHARTELARSALAWSCADPAAIPDALEAALDLCLRVAEDAIQVHGGIGFTWEASPHHYLRHVMAARRIVEAATRV
jgi:alkylation response protein AidB-like acyl-CoA dehydrogenase